MLTVNSVTITTTNTQQHRDTTNQVQQLMLMLIVPSPSQQLSQQQHQNTENLVQQLMLMLVVSSVTATTITTTTLEYNKPSTITNVNSPTTITTAKTSKYRNPVQQLMLMLVISSITFTTAITATTLRYNKPRTIIKVNS